MVTESFRLIEGIEYKGEVHRDVTMRAARVKDTFDAERESEGKGVLFLSLSLLSRQIEKLGTIPKEKITPDLLLALNEEDFDRLSEVREVLKKKVHWQSES